MPTMVANFPELHTILKRTYTGARVALNFSSPLELLVAAILAAQCTDERVNQVTIRLFKKYRKAADYADAPLDELQRDIREVTFFRNKGKYIQQTCRILVEQHGGEVPRTLEELVACPGIARKTANLILGNAFGVPGIMVDTHVKRLSQRLGLSAQTNPDKIERDLMDLMPKTDWIEFSYLLVDHGRAVCKAPTPKCADCVVNHLCPSSTV